MRQVGEGPTKTKDARQCAPPQQRGGRYRKVPAPVGNRPRSMAAIIHPYVFPGITGTMERPFPCEYATPMDILTACCWVFERYGRNCGAYKQASMRHMPTITTDLFLSHEFDNMITADIYKMWCLITLKHGRWKKSRNSAAFRFSGRYLATIANRSHSSVADRVKSATNLLQSDRCFADLYQRCLLAIIGDSADRKVDIEPHLMDRLVKRAA